MLGNRIVKEKQLNLHGLELLVQYKLVKNITLRLKADNTIQLSVPYKITDAQLMHFLEEKEGWLRSKLAARKQQPERYVMGELPFDGEHIWLWGERIDCRFEVDKKAGISFWQTPDCLRFVAPYELTQEDRLVFVESWYMYQIREEGKQLLDSWQKRMGVHYTGLKVHTMKTRWGSCNVRSGRINLNALLACWPKQCLELIVVHELTHLLEASHSQRFYEILSSQLPDWQQRKQLLESFQPL